MKGTGKQFPLMVVVPISKFSNHKTLNIESQSIKL